MSGPFHALGFSGTQRGTTSAQLAKAETMLRAFRDLGADEIHLGDCIGSDAEIYEIAGHFGYRLIGHPPNNPKKRAFLTYHEIYPELPYPKRNRAIVLASGFFFATPNEDYEVLRSGTWSTIRYARTRTAGGIILPNGILTGLELED